MGYWRLLNFFIRVGDSDLELIILFYICSKIDQNYFTGPLPAFIGNLSALQLL